MLKTLPRYSSLRQNSLCLCTATVAFASVLDGTMGDLVVKRVGSDIRRTWVRILPLAFTGPGPLGT